MRILMSMLVFLLVSHAGGAVQLVQLELGKGLLGNARYAAGDTDAQPVVIVHGFLQTADFFTVRRLHESLSESGYTVLSPTLSLGIQNRRQSLQCEALHLHSLDEDVAELNKWVTWLAERTGKQVVLIGHSAGGLILTRLLQSYPDAPVARTILVSLNPLEGQAQGPSIPNGISAYTLGYCKHYPTTEVAFRSYADWGGDQMLNAIREQSRPVSVILGTGDERIRSEWRQIMRDAEIQMIEVQGANHFFDSAHEFDLLEVVEELLEG